MSGVTRRLLALVGLVSLLVVSFAEVSGATPAVGEGARDPTGRVLIVSLPRVTWERLGAVDTPVIDEFLQDAALASLSTRTVGARTSPGDAYLSIGAGNRATASGVDDAGAVLMADEGTDTGTASEIYTRRLGVRPTGALLGVDFAEVMARNDELLYGSVPGSLGSALDSAGLSGGAIANADQQFGAPPARQGALAVLDETGQAPLGEVGPVLLVADPLAPGGVRSDPAVVMAATVRALDEGADMLLVEMSDLERAELARAESTPEAGDDAFAEALSEADSLLGELLSELDADRDMVMLVAPTAPLGAEELTVFALAAPDAQGGWARSSTTRRDGYVSLSDIAATALDHLGVEPGEGMSDTPVTTTAESSTLQERRDEMVVANDRAVFRDEAVGPLTVAFIVLLVVMLILVAFGSTRGGRWPGSLRILALFVMAVPAATYLGGLLPYDPFGVATYGVALLGIAAVITGICTASARGDDQEGPVLVAATTVVVLAVDILTGGHLQLDTIFGYSPIVAGRFAGFGNQAFSLIAVSTLIVACGMWSLSERRGRGTRSVLPAVLLLFGVVIVLVGAPTLGSDVGGVLAAVPAFAVCALLLTGRRIRLSTASIIAAATVVVLVLFALVDLSRPSESRTHLGRFAQQVIDGDAVLILQRKLNANFSVLTSTVWTWVIPAALLFLVYLTWRPNNALRSINADHPSFRAFGVSAITLGVVAWALNDSGVSMPAMMLAVALPYTAVLAIGVRRLQDVEQVAVA